MNDELYSIQITPSPTVQVDNSSSFTSISTIYVFLIFYLLLSFLSFIYLFKYGDKSMNYIHRFFSSFITPIAFFIILFQNTLLFLENIIIEILRNICIHIINPIIRILIYYVFVPIVNLIDYFYRHTTLISSIFRLIYHIFSKIINFVWMKIIYPVFHFILHRILAPFFKFIINYIIVPFYTKVFLPASRYVASLRVFQIILSFIMRCYRASFDFISKIISAAGKICQSIIEAAEEMIKEAYEQVISPFVQLTERIFGQ